MKANNIKMRKWLFVSLIMYKVLYDLVYVVVIGPYFSYANYIVEMDFLKIVISWVVYFFLILDIRRELFSNKFSSLLLFLLDIGYAVPTLTLYGFGGTSHEYFLFFTLYWCLLHFFEFVLCNKLIRLFMINCPKWVYALVIVFIICLGFIVSYKSNGFVIDISLNNVYQRRTLMKQKDISAIDSYAISMLGAVVPVCIALMLEKRKYAFAVILSIVQCGLYSIGAMKKYLFYVVLMWVFFCFVKDAKIKKYILPVLNMLNVVAIIDYFITDGMPQVANYLQRRMFLLPATLSTYYYDFFTKNSPDFFKQSFLRHFGFVSEYDMPIPNIIGGYYEGSFDAVMSNGLCGDAMANLGWLALAVFPFLIMFVITMFNRLLDNRSWYLKVSVATIFFVYISNGAIMSNLLSNGFILIWIILFIDFCTSFKKGSIEACKQ